MNDTAAPNSQTELDAPAQIRLTEEEIKALATIMRAGAQRRAEDAWLKWLTPEYDVDLSLDIQHAQQSHWYRIRECIPSVERIAAFLRQEQGA